MSNIYRLVYTDSSGTSHVLGVSGTGKTDLPGSSPDAEYSINNASLDRKLRDPNVLKIRGESSLLGNIPLTKSEFDGDEPELFWQGWDETNSEWFNEFRGYAESRGSINQDGEFAVKLYSHMKYLAEREISVSVSSLTSLDSILEQGLPSDYVVEVPSDVTPVELADYSISDQGQVFFRELTRPYEYTLAFTGEVDTNGNNIVRYQPLGYGGILETITGKRDSVDGDLDGLFKEWEKADTKNVVNKFRVEAVDPSGNKIEETVTDSSSISEYGERFDSISIDYPLSGASDAQEIGNSLLNPQPGEGGKVRIPRIDGDLTNGTFEVIDSQRNIDDAFTCVKQKSFYPENTTYLTFEFEGPEEAQAQKNVDIRNERASLSTVNQQNLGSTTFSGTTGGDTSNAERDPNDNGVEGNTSNAQRDPNDNGITIGTENGQNINVVDERRDSFDTTIPNSETSIAESNDVDGNWTPMTLEALYHVVGFAFNQDGTNGKSIRVSIDAYPDEGDGTPDILNFRSIFVDKMDNTGASGFSQGGLGFPDSSWIKQITIGVRGQNYGGAEPFYGLRAIGSGVTSTAIDGSFYAYAITHSHPIEEDDIRVVDSTNHPHPDDVRVVDSTEHSDHGTSGSTDDLQADIESTEKTNR